MKVKKVLLCFLFICISLTTFLTVFAHSGRTDANGGHWNHATGEYHYHSGKYAGKSNSSSASKNNENYTIAPQYKPSTEVSKQQNNSYSSTTVADVLILFLIVLFCTPFVVLIVGWIYVSINDYLEAHSPKRKLKKYEKLLNEALILQEKLNNQAEDINKGLPEDCIPDEYEIGEDNLPKDKGAIGWGKTFTMYKTRSGEKIHCKKGCCGAKIEAHAFEYINFANKSTGIFCGICRNSRDIPSCDWYDAYLKRRSLLKEHEKTKEEYSFIQIELSDQRETCQKYLQSVWFASKTFELNEKYKTLRNSQQD